MATNRRVGSPSIRDIPASATVQHRWPAPTNTPQSAPSIGGNDGSKSNGLGRVRNFFGLRPSTAPEQSRTPSIQDISGFRMIPARFSLPRSKSRIAEMWSIDALIDRWIERSIGRFIHRVKFSTSGSELILVVCRSEQGRGIPRNTVDDVSHLHNVFRSLQRASATFRSCSELGWAPSGSGIQTP